MSRRSRPGRGRILGASSVARGAGPGTRFARSFELFDFKVDEFIERAEHVVMPNVTRLRGRDGVEVEAHSVVVATVRERRVVAWCLYRDRGEALKAVGLAE